jgi:AmmeMemoRadiSam system protein A
VSSATPHTLLQMVALADRNDLLRLARASIEVGLDTGRLGPAPAVNPSALKQPRATFVTLRAAANLRGCCGSIEPRFTLAEDVWRNAWASAFADPRVPALAPHEYNGINIHVSVLSPLERVAVSSEADLTGQLRPGIDGLLLELGSTRATFLPAVWENFPDPGDFLRHLKLKAGWPVAFWSASIQVWRYEAEDFGEAEH